MSLGWWCAVLLTGAAPDASSEVMSVLAPTQGGLTTAEVVARAVKTSPEAAKAELDYASADRSADSAWMGYVPRVDLSAGYLRQSRITPMSSPLFPIPDPDALSDFFPVDSYTFMASMSVPASDYFLRIIPGYDAVVTQEEVARFQKEATTEGVALAAIQTYLDAIRARAAVVVAQKSVDVLTEQMNDLEQLAAAGLSTEGDVLQIKAQVANARVRLEQARGAERVAEASLRRTLHVASVDTVELKHGEDLLREANVVVPEEDEALQLALSSRSEIKALERLREVQSDLAKLERVGVFPRLTIDGSAMHAKPNQRVFTDPLSFYTTWQVGVNLRWSPNDAVSSKAEWDNAEREVEKVEQDIIAISDMIAIEVATAVSQYRTVRASIMAAQEGLEAAEGAFADRQNLLAAGQGTTRELLLSEQDLRAAQLQLIGAHLDLRLARARLDRALGRLTKEAIDE